MIADLLLRPDNRLLGGATGDFSLFGGQPVPGIAIGREGGNPGHVNIAAPVVPDAPAVGAAAGATGPAAPVTSIDEPTASDLGGLSPTNYFSAQPTITLPDMGGTPAIAPALAFASPTLLDLPAVTTALGSGGSPPTLGLADVLPLFQTATQDALPGALAQIGGGIVAPVFDQLAVPVGGVVGTVAPITNSVVDMVDGAVTPVTELVGDVVMPVVDTVADTVAPVTDTVSDVAAPVVATVAAAAAPVVDTVAATTAPVAETVSNVAAPVAETVTATTAPVIVAAADTIGTVAATATPAVEAVAAAAEPVADASATATLTQSTTDTVATVAEEGFSGSDPAGGVQTLVGMVANADAFDVIAPGNESADAPPIIDDLASDVADAVPILGDTHDDGHSDDHGLFGDHGGLGIG